jgi:hypothetical protein
MLPSALACTAAPGSTSALAACLQRRLQRRRVPAAGLPGRGTARPPRPAPGGRGRRALPRARARAAAPEEGDEAGDERDDGHVDGRDAHAHEHIPRAEHRPVPVQQVVVEEACARAPCLGPYPILSPCAARLWRKTAAGCASSRVAARAQAPPARGRWPGRARGRAEGRPRVDLVAAYDLDDGEHVDGRDEARREAKAGHQEGLDRPAKRPVPCANSRAEASVAAGACAAGDCNKIKGGLGHEKAAAQGRKRRAAPATATMMYELRMME